MVSTHPVTDPCSFFWRPTKDKKKVRGCTCLYVSVAGPFLSGCWYRTAARSQTKAGRGPDSESPERSGRSLCFVPKLWLMENKQPWCGAHFDFFFFFSVSFGLGSSCSYSAQEKSAGRPLSGTQLWASWHSHTTALNQWTHRWRSCFHDLPFCLSLSHTHTHAVFRYLRTSVYARKLVYTDKPTSWFYQSPQLLMTSLRVIILITVRATPVNWRAGAKGELDTDRKERKRAWREKPTNEGVGEWSGWGNGRGGGRRGERERSRK